MDAFTGDFGFTDDLDDIKMEDLMALDATLPSNFDMYAHIYLDDGANPPQASVVGTCTVCGDKAMGVHYGAYSCDGCKGFFRRSLNQPTEYVCVRGTKGCDISVTTRNKCRFCRLRKCLQSGMKPEALQQPRGTLKRKSQDTLLEEEDEDAALLAYVNFVADNDFPSSSGSQLLQPTKNFGLCTVCGDKATGKHYGGVSCDGCKGFFRRTVRQEHEYAYVCSKNNNCIIAMDSRNACRACRFQKCLAVGMQKSKVQDTRDKIKNKRSLITTQ